MFKVISAFVASIIIIKSIREIKKNIKFDITLDTVIIYLGIYTLLIKLEAEIIDFIDVVVLEVKKLNNNLPDRRYTGKFLILLLNKVEKTIVRTIIVSSGFNKLHSIPRNDPLYFFFISFFTSIVSKK